MKTFDVTCQMRPWYGSPCYSLTVEARNADSAARKAKKEYPDAVWYWVDGEVNLVNQKRLDYFQKLNPGVVFHHF